ncbi:MAG: signal peptidase I [Thermoproteota archaeon]
MDKRVRESLSMFVTTIIVPVVIIAVFISLLNSMMGTSSPLAVVEIDMIPWYVSSMYPTLFPGDLLLLSGKEDLQVGDVVIYRNPYSGRNIVHRIIGIKTDPYGGKRYITKGDYNSYPDSYNPSVEDIVGKWVGVKIHLVGFILLLANTPTGRIILVSTLVILLLTELIRIIRENKGSDASKQALGMPIKASC